MASTLSKAKTALAKASEHTHKYLTSNAAIHRDIAAKSMKRPMFPDAVFTLVKPGVPMPADVVVFRVPLNYNKIQIKDYIEELYKVPVKKVNTAIYIGKRRLTPKGYYYKRPDYKKAFVRLTEEFTFPEFKNTPTARA